MLGSGFVSRPTLSAILWSPPRTPVERGFAVFLAGLFLAGLAWLLTHGNADGWDDLSDWLAVLRGDTTLKLRTRDYVAGGLMLTAVAWIIVPCGLWLTRHWWGRLTPITTAETPLDRRFLLSLALILVLAATIRAPRLGLSLYNDEVDVFRTAIAGSYDGKVLTDLSHDEPAPFRSVTWTDTVWGNRIGNNHALHSLLARAGYDAWLATSGAPAGTVREWPLRLPPFLGGLASIALVALLAWRLTGGNVRAGLIAALLLALHPWHIRYSTEARGYGLVFGFATLACWCLVQALDRRQWRWWLGFGAAQTLSLWSCLASLHLILGLNLAVAVWQIWPRREAAGFRWNPVSSPIIPGWIVANALSAALFLLCAAPLLPPIEMALKLNATFQKGVSPHWWHDVGGYLLLGMPWHDGDPENRLNPAIEKYLASPLIWLALAVAVAALLTGAIRLWRHGGPAGRLLVAAPVFAVVAPWIESSLSGMILLKWYVNYTTLFIALWMAAGMTTWLDWLAPRVSPLRLRVVGYALIALYAAGLMRPLSIYRHQPKQALRESIALARGGTVPPDPAADLHPIVAGWWTHANYYDPRFRIAHDAVTLDTLVQRARREGRPLFFILGMHEAARREDPRVIDRLERSGDFETVKVLPGLEERQFRTYVYRLRPDRL